MGNLTKRRRLIELFSKLITIKYLPRWVILLIDLLLCICAYLLSYLIVTRIVGSNPITIYTHCVRISILLVIQFISFRLLHTYSGILRYSGFVDIVKLIASFLFTIGLLFLINGISYMVQGVTVYLNASIVVYFFIATVFSLLLRIFIKELFEYINFNAITVTRVMIYGTKSQGIAIAKMLRANVDDKYKVIGFVDDAPVTTHLILGLKVYKKDTQLISIMRKRRVQCVIVSPLKMREINPSVDLDIFLNNNIQILSMPMIQTWCEENRKDWPQKMGQIKSIQIEDLLERSCININLDNVKRQLNNKVVMITGAAGSIGSEIVRQIIPYQPQLIILLDQAESPLHELHLDLADKYPQQNTHICIADVRNRQRIESIMDNFRPEIIYHAAAYKHVPLMEDNPSESIQANVMGTKNMADLAVKYGVKRFVMISTDKAVNPTNIMGASKRIAEIYVQSLYKKMVKQDENCTKFITTRFGNVLGSNGSVIPYFKKQIEKGGPVTVTHPNIIRYFMTIPEACWLVLEAGVLGNGGEIFIFDMGTPVKILDLAKKMIRLAGYKPGIDIKIAFTGLRPGEKLYEELLNKKEITKPTTHPKIMIAQVQEFNFDEVATKINDLIEISYTDKTFMTVSKMKEIVPEYISKNSPFEQLDA